MSMGKDEMKIPPDRKEKVERAKSSREDFEDREEKEYSEMKQAPEDEGEGIERRREKKLERGTEES